MNKIIVTYDLRGVDKNYDELLTRLNAFPVCLKLNNSSYLINTGCEASVVRDELVQFIDSNDSIFVAELTGTAAWRNADSDSEDIKKALRV